MGSVLRSLLVILTVVVVRCCGAPSTRPARPAGLGDVPYSVVVSSGGVCSGALMGRRYVVTAAHCLHRVHNKNTSLPEVTVIAGSLNTDKLEQENSSSQRLLSESVFFYPSYSKKWAEHDIAVIKPIIVTAIPVYELPQFSFTFSQQHPPVGPWQDFICPGLQGYGQYWLQDEFNLTAEVGLVPLSSEPWGSGTRQCEVSGYGRLQKGVNSTLDHQLKTHDLNITKPCPCEAQLIVEKGDRVQNWLCSELGSYSGPCKGDSGAPLVCDGRLWGLTSSTFYIYHPETCNMSREPDHSLCGSVHELNIFMDINPYLSWIQEIMASTSSSRMFLRCSVLLSFCICYIVYNTNMF